jgi:putative transcriptional regulator
MRLLDLFEQMELPQDGPRAGDNIFNGGPVSLEQGFVLHRQGERWQSTLDIGDGIALTTSRDILASIAANEGPNDALVAIGYAGWGAGQLEEELADNAWLTVPASAEIIFDTPVDERAGAAAKTLGIDINLLADCVGHA